jgi:GNAT superfamily N-acetyltransferase
VNVRGAQPGDVPAIAALLAQLSYPVEPAALARRMERLPAETTIFVADAGEVVGLAGLDVRQGLQHDAPGARLIAFVVREDARRRGVARALLAAVEAAAREAGCEHLHVTAANRRTDAHAAYRALGFSDTGVRFGKYL